MSESEKEDKRIANRRYRRDARQRLRNGQEVLPQIREMSDVWGFDKDGKRWYGYGRYPELMRK